MSNDILQKDGTAFTFKSTGGSALWTPTSLANGAGRLSTQLDLGASPRAYKFQWRLVLKFVATPSVGFLVRPYLLEAGSAATTYQDGIIGLTDAAIATEAISMYAGKLLGPCGIQTAGTAFQVWSGRCKIQSRYVSLMLWNASGAALSATATDHEFRLEPVNDQVQ